MPGSFFDTNVLIYLVSEPAKALRVRDLLRAGGTISTQVLNEIAECNAPEIALFVAGDTGISGPGPRSTGAGSSNISGAQIRSRSTGGTV